MIVLTFYSRNHHTINSPSQTFMKYTTKSSNVEEELKELADFHNKLTSYTDAKIIYVDSNHDRALDRFF